MKHAANCLIYLCTCGPVSQANFIDLDAFSCDDDCECEQCLTDREAILDREFDEKSALAYI